MHFRPLWSITVFSVVIGISALAAAQPEAGDKSKSLDGIWMVSAMEANGQPVDVKKGIERFVIKGGKATFFAGGKEIPTFKDLGVEFESGKNSKAVNLIRGNKESLPSLYELKDNVLKLAMPLVPADRKPEDRLPRPESFDTKDKPVMLLTATRSKE